MFTTFPWVYVSLFDCFKQLPVNFTLILLARYLIDGERLVVDNPLDCHDKIDNVLVINLKHFFSGWNTTWFCVPSSSKWLLPIK